MDARTPILVRFAMTAGAETIEPANTVQRAAQRMRAANIGLLVVSDPSEGVLGVVTDRDIAVRGCADGRDPTTTPVREVMTHQVISCFDDNEIQEAAHLMEKHSVRRLLVTDREGRLVGVLSIDDVAHAGGAGVYTGEILRHISTET